MAWRVSKALDTLLSEINARAPKRSKASDGGIGNEEHQTRDSDHNPWVKDGTTGVVTARDFTDDPGDGFDASNFANWLRERCRTGKEKRVKYIISDGRICSGTKEAWAWRPYTGPNAHTKHVHVSVLPSKTFYDDTRSWGWSIRGVEVRPAPKPVDPLDAAVTLTATSAKALGRKTGEYISLRTILQWGKGKL